nr:MAG TPA: hypothetical protein [Bacteriophage sp.]
MQQVILNSSNLQQYIHLFQNFLFLLSVNT